jgi:hypothetical protein
MRRRTLLRLGYVVHFALTPNTARFARPSVSENS